MGTFKGFQISKISQDDVEKMTIKFITRKAEAVAEVWQDSDIYLMESDFLCR
jgi:hypothetical protein